MILMPAYVYCRGGRGGGHSISAPACSRRRVALLEDPATGSATVQMAAQLLAAEKLKDGKHAFAFEQGYEMGRPSQLALEADIDGGAIREVRLAGSAVRMMSGWLEL